MKMNSAKEELNLQLLSFKKDNSKLGYKRLAQRFNKLNDTSITPNYYKSLVKKTRKRERETDELYITQSELEKQVEKNKQLLYTNQIIRKDLRYYEKQSHLQDRVIQTIESYIMAMPQRKYKIPQKKRGRKKKRSSCELVLLLSDFHIGEVVNKEEMVGLSEYNFEIFCKRFQFLMDKVAEIKTEVLDGAYDVQKLNILFLGDIVCGDIHEELSETAQGTVIEWSFNGASFIAPYLAELSHIFPQIDICGVVGNHGRLKKKPRFKLRYVNWDTVFYKALELHLSNIDNIDCQFDKGLFHLKDVCGFNFLMMHGDGIRSSLGIPWYGINRTDANLTGTFASKEKYYNYLCLGHFHQPGTLDRWAGEKIINGNLKGGDEFSLGAMATVSEPKQILFGVFPKYGKSGEYKLNVKYGDELTTEEIRYNCRF